MTAAEEHWLDRKRGWDGGQGIALGVVLQNARCVESNRSLMADTIASVKLVEGIGNAMSNPAMWHTIATHRGSTLGCFNEIGAKLQGNGDSTIIRLISSVKRCVWGAHKKGACRHEGLREDGHPIGHPTAEEDTDNDWTARFCR